MDHRARQPLPWRCHRNLVSDDLVARGMRVFHLIGVGSVQEHRLNSVARLREGALVYEGQAQAKMGF